MKNKLNVISRIVSVCAGIIVGLIGAMYFTGNFAGSSTISHAAAPIKVPFYENRQFDAEMTAKDVQNILVEDGHTPFMESDDGTILTDLEWYGVEGVLLFCFDDDGKLAFVAWGDNNSESDFDEREIDSNFYTTIKAALTLKYGQMKQTDIEDAVCWGDGDVVFKSNDHVFSITCFRCWE